MTERITKNENLSTLGYDLSILIATVEGREPSFDIVMYKLKEQIFINHLENRVEILHKKDRKEISVGAKRQALLEESKGEYIVFFDDDDEPYPNYLTEIMCGIEQKPDCIGMLIHMTTNGMRPQTCCHSLKYKDVGWRNNYDGYDYVRNVTHFNPVKRSLAMIVGFPDKRHGEDKAYSDVVTQLCKTEYFIPRKIFHYKYSNYESHDKKYGFKR